MTFATFVAVDWTGAVGERHTGIAIATCEAGGGAPTLVRPGHRWSRGEVGSWVGGLSAAGERALVGFDFCFGFPFADVGAYFPGDVDGPATAKTLWAEVTAVAAGDPHDAAHGYVAHRRRHFWLGETDGPRAARARLRVVERRWEAKRNARGRGCGAASSVFALLGAAQCGKASLAGMRLLARTTLPVWPLDPVPATGPLLVEIYCRSFVADAVAMLPSARRERIGKVTERDRLDRLLAALGSDPVDPAVVPPTFSDHVGDALIAAAGMRARAADPATWDPAGLAAVAATEGWTFGIV